MRTLALIALLAASCSYSEEKADITVHVAGIPTNADHLNVVLTPSDTTVATHGCTTEMAGTASNSVCYRPSFQPGSLVPPEMDLAFANPAAAGTVKIDITALDRNLALLATGTVTAPLPGPSNLQVTLH